MRKRELAQDNHIQQFKIRGLRPPKTGSACKHSTDESGSLLLFGHLQRWGPFIPAQLGGCSYLLVAEGG
jgi:hypothetical protein